MPVSDFIIYGSFGFGNSGDEAVPEAVHDMLENIKSDAHTYTFTRFDNPETEDVVGMGAQYSRLHDKTRGLPMILSGGGVIEPSHFSCLFRAEPIIRRRDGGRATLFACSVEPGVDFSWRYRWRLRSLLKLMGTVYTRDLLSEQTLNALIPSVRTETIGDLVLWMRPAYTEKVAELQIPDRYITCILASCWRDDNAWTNWITSELARASQELNATLVFLPMSTRHDDDRLEHARISKEIRQKYPDINIYEIAAQLQPREVCQIISESLVTISMRLHGCVMAYAQSTPFVSIVYHPKLFGFLETVGCLNRSLPRTGPRRQTSKYYGYSFSDLELNRNDLSKAIEEAFIPSSNTRLDELKEKSLNALREILR